MAKRKDELTIKQEKYCNERIKGKSQRQAYKAAYNADNMKDSTIDRTAFELEHSRKIAARLNYLRSLNSKESIATKDDIAKSLSAIAYDDSKSDAIRLKAFEQLSKIQGYLDNSYNVSFNGSLLTGKDKAAAIKDYINGLRK